MGSDMFLKLLVAEMKYQDPSSPMSTSDMMAQTATLTQTQSLQQIQQQNAQLVSLQRSLAAVGLAGREQNNPNQLSGGQQQRVAVARSLVNNPALILADEPTGNLDSRTSVEVMALFQELNAQGITILIVTHEPDVAQYATRIVEVRDGRIRRDHPVDQRRNAAEDLRNLDADVVIDVQAERAEAA